jgi:chaperonin cofactor prefoldin
VEVADILKKLEQAKEHKARLEGQKDQLMAALKALGHDTVESARKELDELDEYIKTTEPTYTEQYEQFLNDYGDTLAAINNGR